MPRSLRPASKAAVARYASLLVDPLYPLAKELGKAVAHEVRLRSMKPSRAAERAAGPGSAGGQVSAAALEAHVTILVRQVLEQCLSSQDAEGTAIRMAIIAKLATIEAVWGGRRCHSRYGN